MIRVATVKDAESIARVHLDTWRTTYQGIVSQTYLDSLNLTTRMKNWESILREGSERSKTIVAVDESENNVIGFASMGPCRERDLGLDSELYAIYLGALYQKRGFGRQLFQRAVCFLESSGFSSMLVWVLKDNSSRLFYEKMGGSLVAEKEDEIGGVRLKEWGYGWKPLRGKQRFRSERSGV